MTSAFTGDVPEIEELPATAEPEVKVTVVVLFIPEFVRVIVLVSALVEVNEQVAIPDESVLEQVGAGLPVPVIERDGVILGIGF